MCAAAAVLADATASPLAQLRPLTVLVRAHVALARPLSAPQRRGFEANYARRELEVPGCRRCELRARAWTVADGVRGAR